MKLFLIILLINVSILNLLFVYCACEISKMADEKIQSDYSEIDDD